jgi:hypothetical protein
VTQGGHTVLVRVIAGSSRSHHSFGYHSPLCRAEGRTDRFCVKAQDFDLASHKALEVVVDQDRLALLRRDWEQRGDCCD